MKIRVTLKVGDEQVKQDVLEIAEHKLGELSEEEIQGAVEIRVRDWADRLISVEWETDDEDGE